jgi:hypothetical protein
VNELSALHLHENRIVKVELVTDHGLIQLECFFGTCAVNKASWSDASDECRARKKVKNLKDRD